MTSQSKAAPLHTTMVSLGFWLFFLLFCCILFIFKIRILCFNLCITLLLTLKVLLNLKEAARVSARCYCSNIAVLSTRHPLHLRSLLLVSKLCDQTDPCQVPVPVFFAAASLQHRCLVSRTARNTNVNLPAFLVRTPVVVSMSTSCKSWRSLVTTSSSIVQTVRSVTTLKRRRKG